MFGPGNSELRIFVTMEANFYGKYRLLVVTEFQRFVPFSVVPIWDVNGSGDRASGSLGDLIHPLCLRFDLPHPIPVSIPLSCHPEIA